MADSNSFDQATNQREIPDSEEDSSIDTRLPDEKHSPSRQSTAATTVSACNLATSIASRSATDDPERPSSLSPRTLELQRKITQMRSTIEDAEAQLSEMLGKLSTLPPFQRQDSAASPSVRLPANLHALADLPLDQQHTIAQAQKTLDQHIRQLGEYNQLKDIAMGMLDMIAEKEGKTLREIMDARDVEDDDDG